MLPKIVLYGQKTRKSVVKLDLIQGTKKSRRYPCPSRCAAVVEQFGEPLELVEWDVPSPGTNQIL
jgi:hypothetical protein